MRPGNLEQELFEELCGIPTVDAHKHLPPESIRLKEPRDFYSLFQHYFAGDLLSAPSCRRSDSASLVS